MASWSDVGGKLLGLGLPLLGTALAGPAGGTVGALIAAKLGVDTQSPDAVAGALDADTTGALVALRTLQEEHAHELEKTVIAAGTAEIEAVNATMRTEALASDPWTRRWRPCWGFLSSLAWAWMVAAIGLAIVRGQPSEAIRAVADVPEVFWLIPLAILGVASWHRGKAQRILAGEQPQETWADKAASIRESIAAKARGGK